MGVHIGPNESTINYLTSFIETKLSYKGKGRKNKKPIYHYLENIFWVLTTGSQWKHLKAPLHHTTYHKKILLWSKKGFFNDAFKALIQQSYSKGYLNDIKDLYIDSCMVKNVSGLDMIGPNHYDRFRKASKITLVVTDKGIPLGSSMAKANTHDTKETFPPINNIPIPLGGNNLIADKGYISRSNRSKLGKKVLT